MISVIDGVTSNGRIRKRIVFASVTTPVLYAFLVWAHGIMERYFRLKHHDIYGICQPIIFFMICGVLLASLVVAANAILCYRRFDHWAWAALCVLIALSPILFIYIRA